MAESAAVTTGLRITVARYNNLRNDVISTTLGHQHNGTDGRAHEDSGFKWFNPAKTFSYTIRTSAITANRDLTLPLISANATLAVLGLAQTWTTEQTIQVAGNTLNLQNTTDAPSNQVAKLGGGDRATPANNDEAYASLLLDNDLGTQTEFVRLTWKALTVLNTNKGSRPEFQYYTANTLRELAFPAISADDTVAVLTLAQTLTNKTLTAPAINGTVTTTGLLLPAFEMLGIISTAAGSGMIFQAGAGANIRLVAGGTGLVKLEPNTIEVVIVDDADPQFLVGGQAISTTVRVDSTGTAINSTFLATVGASSTGGGPRLILREGSGSGAAGNAFYKIQYNPNDNYFRIESGDSDGVPTAADIIRIPDGQLTVDGNSTFDANAFDDVDDAMVLWRAFSPEARRGRNLFKLGQHVLRANRRELIEMGVLRLYPDGWVGYSDQRMAALLAGGIYQTRQRLDRYQETAASLFDAHNERITALEEKIAVLEARG